MQGYDQNVMIYHYGIFTFCLSLKGALAGGIVGLIASGYLAFKAQTEILLENIVYETKPLSTNGCTYDFTPLPNKTREFVTEESKSLHNISYLYFSGESFF
jgi:sodium-coupled monocarboxylate transporter 8/12